MSKKVRGSDFDFSSTMTGGGATWQRSKTFTVSNEAMWARWYENATEVLQIYTSFDHLRLHKIQVEVHTQAFFLQKTEGCPTCEHFINLVADSEWIILVVAEESASNDGVFYVPCASCASWCKFRDAKRFGGSIIYIYSHSCLYRLFIYL